MIQVFKQITSKECSYGVSHLGLKSGDTFQVIRSNLSAVRQTGVGTSVYEYEYLIAIDDHCIWLDCDEFKDLMAYSMFIEDK